MEEIKHRYVQMAAAENEQDFICRLPDLNSPEFTEFIRQLNAKDLKGKRWAEHTVFAEDYWNMTCFYLPENKTMPFHDHMQLFGALKVVSGVLEITSHDWVDDQGSGNVTQATVLQVDEYSGFQLVTPASNNIHKLHALEDTLFVDVFSPYYDNRSRPCRYFDYSDTSNTRLIEVPKPVYAP